MLFLYGACSHITPTVTEGRAARHDLCHPLTCFGSLLGISYQRTYGPEQMPTLCLIFWKLGGLIHSFIGLVLIALASLELIMLATLASNSPTSDLKVMGSWAHTTMPCSILDCVCAHVHVYLCICVFMYMCVHVHICVIACGITGRSLAFSSITPYVSFFESGYLLNPDFTDLAEEAG